MVNTNQHKLIGPSNKLFYTRIDDETLNNIRKKPYFSITEKYGYKITENNYLKSYKFNKRITKLINFDRVCIDDEFRGFHL